MHLQMEFLLHLFGNTYRIRHLGLLSIINFNIHYEDFVGLQTKFAKSL
jgi:hypothetical protein